MDHNKQHNQKVQNLGYKDIKTAWFEKEVDSNKLDKLRGNGVLIIDKQKWRIAQYVLSVLIPNEKFFKVKNILEIQQNQFQCGECGQSLFDNFFENKAQNQQFNQIDFQQQINEPYIWIHFSNKEQLAEHISQMVNNGKLKQFPEEPKIKFDNQVLTAEFKILHDQEHDEEDKDGKILDEIKKYLKKEIDNYLKLDNELLDNELKIGNIEVQRGCYQVTMKIIFTYAILGILAWKLQSIQFNAEMGVQTIKFYKL